MVNNSLIDLSDDVLVALKKAYNIIQSARLKQLPELDKLLKEHPQLLTFHIKNNYNQTINIEGMPASLLIAAIYLSKTNEEAGLKFTQLLIDRGVNLNITKEEEQEKKQSPIMYSFNKNTLFLLMENGAKFTQKEYDKFFYILQSDSLKDNPLSQMIIQMLDWYDTYQLKIKLENTIENQKTEKDKLIYKI